MHRELSGGPRTYFIWLRVSSEADYECPLDRVETRWINNG